MGFREHRFIESAQQTKPDYRWRDVSSRRFRWWSNTSGIYWIILWGSGIPGGAGAPFGRVMTGQPISNDSQDYRLYLESYLWL